MTYLLSEVFEIFLVYRLILCVSWSAKKIKFLDGAGFEGFRLLELLSENTLPTTGRLRLHAVMSFIERRCSFILHRHHSASTHQLLVVIASRF